MKNITINQSGRSMIEMLGVLAIVGVLSVGGIAGYSKAMQKYRVNKTIEMVTQLANGIRTLYSGRQNYDGLSGQVVYKAKIIAGIDSNNVNQLYSIKSSNPFGGYITVGSLGENPKNFFINLTNIPEDACVELMSQDWGNESGLIAYGANPCNGSYETCWNTDIVFANKNLCRSDDHMKCAKNGPMTVDEAMTACSSTNENSVSWNFY